MPVGLGCLIFIKPADGSGESRRWFPVGVVPRIFFSGGEFFLKILGGMLYFLLLNCVLVHRYLFITEDFFATVPFGLVAARDAGRFPDVLVLSEARGTCLKKKGGRMADASLRRFTTL